MQIGSSAYLITLILLFLLSKLAYVATPVNFINIGTITPGKSPMFERSQDGGNNYEMS